MPRFSEDNLRLSAPALLSGTSLVYRHQLCLATPAFSNVSTRRAIYWFQLIKSFGSVLSFVVDTPSNIHTPFRDARYDIFIFGSRQRTPHVDYVSRETQSDSRSFELW